LGRAFGRGTASSRWRLPRSFRRTSIRRRGVRSGRSSAGPPGRAAGIPAGPIGWGRGASGGEWVRMGCWVRGRPVPTATLISAGGCVVVRHCRDQPTIGLKPLGSRAMPRRNTGRCDQVRRPEATNRTPGHPFEPPLSEASHGSQ